MTNIFAYHWAPRDRRARIIKVGLLPGQLSSDRIWRPPYVCLAPYAELAWQLSGGTTRGKQIKDWDLWEARLGEQNGVEGLFFDNGNTKELRVYERIYKRNVWYVGSRSHGGL
jgi:hypothetical protein